MRSAVLVAILVTSAALLAGCSGKKEDDDHAFTCPNGTTLDLEKFPDHHNATFNPVSHCPHASTSASNSTSLAPNQLPILKLKVTDGKNETPVTMLNGNLTFDASGSSDPDGQVTGIAVTVQDSNTTRTAALFDPAKKTFKPATFKFDRPGVVNVTVAMVDDRAGFTVNQTHVYVNHLQMKEGAVIHLPSNGGAAPAGMDPCKGATGDAGSEGAIVDANYFKSIDFDLFAGATRVDVTADAGEAAHLTICNPAKDTALGSGDGTATTDPGVALPPPTGIASYSVGVYSNDEPEMSTAMTVLVHYEPQTA
jgi:hypothetical protein